MRILLEGHREPCYSLSPTCGTTSIGVHQPCTVDYPDRSVTVMLNEPSNHKNPLLSSSKLDGRSNHHFTLLSQLPLYPTQFSLILFLISSRKPRPASAIVLLSQRRKGERINGVDSGQGPILQPRDLSYNSLSILILGL